MKKIAIAALVFALGFPHFSQAQLADEPRPFAAGVLQVIQPDLRPEDSFSPPLRIPGLDAEKYSPNFASESETLFGSTRQVVFFRDVWAFEFATLGLRQIELQVANPDGTSTRKNYFYLPYRVRNTGKSLKYEQVKEGLTSDVQIYKLNRTGTEAEDEETVVPVGPEKFRPEFSLEGWVVDPNNEYQHVTYADRYLPSVVKSIQQSEDPNRTLLDKFQLESMPIPVMEDESDPGVWAVAVWEDVNPNMDFISIYVRGITNAYKIKFDAEANQKLQHKTLQLNFWRPGDSVDQTRDAIIYGIPLVDKPRDQIEVCQKYHLPGPRLDIYLNNLNVDGETKIGSVDAEIDYATLESPSVAQLTAGEFPEVLAFELNGRGFDVANASQLMELVPGQLWKFTLELDGVPREFQVRFQPQFWEKEGEGIRFLRSLAHLWVYR